MWTALAICLLCLWGCIREPRTIYWIAGIRAYVLWNYARYVAYAVFIMLTKDRTLVLNWDKFWKRYLYGDVKECWNRPVHSGPGRKITVAERYKSIATLPLEETGNFIECINMGSYNYLGTGGSCISDEVWNPGELKDRWMIQTQVELAITRFLKKEFCVIVPTGYATNASLIPCIIDLCDGEVLVLSDSLNHTSIVKGIQLREGRCKVAVFEHGNMTDLRNKYTQNYGSNKSAVLIIVEGLYSMEGDYAPLQELVDFKGKHDNVYLYVDEAHSIGALGKTGRGICEHAGVRPQHIDFLMGTFTKSFASIGGYVVFQNGDLGRRVELLYHKRFEKEIVPLHATCSRQIIKVIEWLDTKEGKLSVDMLRKNSIYLRQRLIKIGCEILGEYDSPVIPLMVREVHRVEEINRLFLKCGFAVVSVGYPATPLLEGCRLRFCVSAKHKQKDMDDLVEIVDQSMELFSMLRMQTRPDSAKHKKDDDEEVESSFVDTHLLFPPVPKLPEEKYPMINEEEYKYPHAPPLLEEPLDEESLQVLKTYGCGSCGPRGFYGTMDIHIKLEKKLALFYDREDAAIYAHGQCVASSVIPQLVDTLGGPNKVMIVIPEDWVPRYDIKLAFRLSKAPVGLIGSTHSSKTHLIVITPDYDAKTDMFKGLDKNNDMTWVVDEFGRPFGDTKKQKLPDLILGTFETNDVKGMGGFCVGKASLIEPQRLYAKSYVFSASLPPYLCQFAMSKMDAL